MASDDKGTSIEQLKTEGNALHLKGDHSGALSKYSEAIKLDPENAVLYANRAAAYISLKQFLDAAKDAQKAVEINPNYGKAWARLAKSSSELFLFERSVHAWKEALKTLPSDDLSQQDIQLKKQYEEGLKLAEEGPKNFENRMLAQNRFHNIPEFSPEDPRMPWNRALEMESVLTANSVLNTSAWPLMNAYKDFSEGVRCMKQIKKTPQGIEANLNALQSIMGGILRDERVFHMDSSDWLEKLQLQVQLELTAFGGWPDGDPESVKEAAVKLQAEKGWKAMRMAVGSTIRAWFFRAYFAHKSGRSWAVAMQSYNSVVDVLEWGAVTWADVPSSDRGHIFQKTFVRAVRRIRMEAYLGALTEAEGDDTEYTVEELMDMANQMVEETTNNFPKEGDDAGALDKGAWYSFHVFPVADAHATLGAIFMQQGLSAKKDGDAEEAERMLAAAFKFYKQAAEMCPPDDEQFPFFLKIAFEAQWHRGRPLSETIALCERIRKAIPAVNKIWGFNPFGILKVHMHQLADWMTRAMEGVLEGKCTLETPSTDIPLLN